MSGLDVTHRAVFTQDDTKILRSQGGKVSLLVADLIDFFLKYHIKIGSTGAPLHDPCAVAYLVEPQLFTTRPYHIDIECTGKFTSGMTLADRRPWSKADHNVLACIDIEREGFIRLIVEACKSYNT
jgi:pyrimidine-specific ribonucleoside hydrolase